MDNKNHIADGLLTAKLVHVAIPVRWSLFGQQGRRSTETACTYDIHPRGARLLTTRTINIGDVVVVERGRNKALCQVIWTADPCETDTILTSMVEANAFTLQGWGRLASLRWGC